MSRTGIEWNGIGQSKQFHSCATFGGRKVYENNRSNFFRLKMLNIDWILAALSAYLPVEVENNVWFSLVFGVGTILMFTH